MRKVKLHKCYKISGGRILAAIFAKSIDKNNKREYNSFDYKGVDGKYFANVSFKESAWLVKMRKKCADFHSRAVCDEHAVVLR